MVDQHIRYVALEDFVLEPAPTAQQYVFALVVVDMLLALRARQYVEKLPGEHMINWRNSLN